jgi:hypothetical protein
MSTIKLNGTTSGSSIIKAPDSGSTNQTFTLPASSGTLAKTSDIPSGITSSADATAITITSAESVGIGTATPVTPMGSDKCLEISDNSSVSLVIDDTRHTNPWTIRNAGGVLSFNMGTTTALSLTDDGVRGLSQFTAKAWVNFNGANTVSINDSHNVSSITDNGTGNYSINFSNNMANTNYSLTSMSKAYSQYGNYSDSFGTFAVGSVVIEHREGGQYTDAQKFCGNIFGD